MPQEHDKCYCIGRVHATSTQLTQNTSTEHSPEHVGRGGGPHPLASRLAVPVRTAVHQMVQRVDVRPAGVVREPAHDLKNRESGQ